MSRATNAVAAARLLLVSLPLAIAYPQIIPPFELLNTSSSAVLSTSIPEETAVYIEPSITYSYADPAPTTILPGTDDVSSSSPTLEPTPIANSGTTSPLDPILLPPPYPLPTPEAPSVSITSFLAVVQPLLDIIRKLDIYGPYSTGPLQKRSTAATNSGLPVGNDALIISLIKKVLELLSSAAPLGVATGAAGTVTNAAGAASGGSPVSAATGNLGGAANNVPVGAVPGSIGGITGRALRRRQIPGLGSVAGATKPVGSVANTAAGAAGSVTGAVPGAGNVVPAGGSVAGNVPSVDPSSIPNTVAGEVGSANAGGNLPVDPTSAVGSVANTLPPPASNLVPAGASNPTTVVTSMIPTKNLDLVNTLLNTILSLLTGGGLFKRSTTTATLSSTTRPELHKREAHLLAPARKMRFGERKRQSANADLDASSPVSYTHL